MLPKGRLGPGWIGLTCKGSYIICPFLSCTCQFFPRLIKLKSIGIMLGSNHHSSRLVDCEDKNQ